MLCDDERRQLKVSDFFVSGLLPIDINRLRFKLDQVCSCFEGPRDIYPAINPIRE
jgi:hypothetical protein